MSSIRLRYATQISVKKVVDVLVIGYGVAGCLAALAARKRRAYVIIVLVPNRSDHACLCVITVSLPTEIVFRPYRNIFAAKIVALSFVLLSQGTIFLSIGFML
jgi:threonine dehydrogenase-like Zn-dependent dehydrogenase